MGAGAAGQGRLLAQVAMLAAGGRDRFGTMRLLHFAAALSAMGSTG
jgi:hypothetical protein